MTTSGKAWRKAREEGIEFTFPSGNVAMIRPVEAECFIRVGKVPDSLAGILSEIVNGKVPERLPTPAAEQVEKWQEWIAFLNELTTFAFVSPRIVDTPEKEDEIAIDDVSYQDKLMLYSFFTRPAKVLERFREIQTGGVATVATVAKNGTAALETAQNQSMGGSTSGDAGYMDGAAIR